MAMAFVCRAAAAVTTAGWAPGVTRGRVTLAAMNMALARTENVNAVRVGTESTALLVGWEGVLVWGRDVYVCVWEGFWGANTSVGSLFACVCEALGVKGRVHSGKRGGKHA